MEKIELLEDIIKGNSNPDVRQEDQDRGSALNFMMGVERKGREETAGKASY